MICPAILDPFQGSNYRLNACLHQALLCPLVAKAFSLLFSTQRESDDDFDDTDKLDGNHSADANYKYIIDQNNTRIKVRSMQGIIYNNVDKQEWKVNDETHWWLSIVPIWLVSETSNKLNNIVLFKLFNYKKNNKTKTNSHSVRKMNVDDEYIPKIKSIWQQTTN